MSDTRTTNPNEGRADRGASIVTEYTDLNHNDGDDWSEVLSGLRSDVSDAIADLLHLGERYGLDADDLLDKAKRAWEADSEDGPRVERRRELSGHVEPEAQPERPRAASVIHLRANLDVNGNPRRAFAVFAAGGAFLGCIDEGYEGEQALYAQFPEAREIWPVQVDVPVSEYKRFLRRIPTGDVAAIEQALNVSSS